MIYPNSKTILEVRNLCVSVEGTPILKNMNFTVRLRPLRVSMPFTVAHKPEHFQ